MFRDNHNNFLMAFTCVLQQGIDKESTEHILELLEMVHTVDLKRSMIHSICKINIRVA